MDIYLLSHYVSNTNGRKTNKLVTEAQNAEPVTNTNKTKVMRIKKQRTEKKIQADLEDVNTFTYLAVIVHEDGGIYEDVKTGINKACVAILQFRRV